MRQKLTTSAVALVGLLTLILSAAPAALAGPSNDEPIAVVRVESVDLLLDDLSRLPFDTTLNFDRDTLLAPVLSQFGISDARWIDTGRPVALVLPTEGMALGNRGLVGVLPVRGADAAIAALGPAFDRVETDGDVHELYLGDNVALVAQARGNYLLIGLSRDLVVEMDLGSVLDIVGLPPGNIAVDVNLEAVAPIALMGLASGRQMIEQQMKQQAAAVPDTEGAQQMNPEAALQFVSLYFDLLRDMLGNANRLQFSFELAPEHFIVHKRLVPKPGSTLSGLTAAQKGGLPALARLVDQGDNVAAVAGQITYTPEFLAALNSYTRAYTDAMQVMASSAGEQAGSEWIATWFDAASPLLEQWPDCYRGDFAGTFTLDADDGFSVVQVVGTDDEDVCRSLLKAFADVMKGAALGSDDAAGFSVTEDALIHQGVRAMRQEFAIDLPPEAQEDEAAAAMIEMMFGDGRMVSFSGIHDNVLMSTTGADAEDRFKDLVDRVVSKRRTSGLAADAFEPLTVGPGIFVTFDFGRLMRTMTDVMAAGGAKDAQDAAAVFGSMPDGVGRIVYGARFDRDAMNVEMAVPLAMIETLTAAAKEKAAEAQALHGQGDHQGHHGHDDAETERHEVKVKGQGGS